MGGMASVAAGGGIGLPEGGEMTEAGAYIPGGG